MAGLPFAGNTHLRYSMNTMHMKNYRRVLTHLLALLHLMMSLMWILPATSAHAQSAADSEPPVIDFEAVSEGYAGDSQVFTATVSDDTNVEVVTLYYRFSEDALYANRIMSPLGSSGIYTTTIETDVAPAGTTSIQYYMEALDSAGNRTLQGFAFDPIERELVDTPVAVAESASAPVVAGMSTGRKIVYGVLGLVVVGAIASSAGGGGGSDPGVPVTINVQELP